MLMPILALLVGLPLLLWSSDKFISGSSGVAFRLRVSPLVVGMFIVGFGTSAPELLVSVISASGGNPGLAIGNIYGSNITNIALVLGITALISPVVVHSDILRKELPILLGTTFLAGWLLFDLTLSTLDAILLLGVFSVIVFWTFIQTQRGANDPLAEEMRQEQSDVQGALRYHLFWLIWGLCLLVLSSRVIVWAAVEVAGWFNINEVIIGLTVVGIGTSLPELVSSIVATDTDSIK